MKLETERLILRPWEESDAEALFEYARDERIGLAAGWHPHTDVENSREIIRTVLSAPENYAVCLKETGRPVGSIGLMPGMASWFRLPEDEAEIGYWIGVPFWGRGLIPEAMRELIRHAFCELGFVRLWCGYFDGNEKSRRAQEKCGFRYHHTNKDLYWAPLDVTCTEHVTRLTKAQWLGEAQPGLRLFKSVIDADRAPVVLCETDHTVAYMNRAAVARYTDKILGTSIMNCHNARSRELLERVLQWFRQSPENNIVYESYNDKENKDVYIVALRDDEGKLIGYYEKHEYRNRERAAFYDMQGSEA